MRVFVFFLLLLSTPHLIDPVHAQEPPVIGEESTVDEEFFEDDLAFDEDEPPLTVRDPIEPVNRAVFWFNDKLYFYLFKPVARGLRVVPERVRVSADNFFDNLSAPLRFINNVLQLQFNDAGDELARFIFNSTFGVAGLFDIAKEEGGIAKRDEDFGPRPRWKAEIHHPKANIAQWPDCKPTQLPPRQNVGLAVGAKIVDWADP
jgi:phospholipid-binding lipoprotein MlaA